MRHLNLFHETSSPSVKTAPKPDGYNPPAICLSAKFTRFANSEIKVELGQSTQGKDVFIVQDLSNLNPVYFSGNDSSFTLNVNDHLMTLLTTINAAKLSGARRVCLVLPTYPYSRQHKISLYEPLTASFIGRILENLGVDDIITLDIHSPEIKNSFKTLHLSSLHASYQILKNLSEEIDLSQDDLVIASPDMGGVNRNKFYANVLGKPLAMLYKERDYSKVSRNADSSNIISTRLLGSVQGKRVFITDDILGTGGTMINALKTLKEAGATDIYIALSLPMFTGTAEEDFDKAHKEGYFTKIIGTNGVTSSPSLIARPWFSLADISGLFARGIVRLYNAQSLNPLIDNTKIIRDLMKKLTTKGV